MTNEEQECLDDLKKRGEIVIPRGMEGERTQLEIFMRLIVQDRVTIIDDKLISTDFTTEQRMLIGIYKRTHETIRTLRDVMELLQGLDEPNLEQAVRGLETAAARVGRVAQRTGVHKLYLDEILKHDKRIVKTYKNVIY